ncbi:MAG: hypothetical protein AAGD13_00700 [Pseudomonadota bacterium]
MTLTDALLITCPACNRAILRPRCGVRPCPECLAPIGVGRADNRFVIIDPTAEDLTRMVNLEAAAPGVTGWELGEAIYPEIMPRPAEPGFSPRFWPALALFLACPSLIGWLFFLLS